MNNPTVSLVHAKFIAANIIARCIRWGNKNTKKAHDDAWRSLQNLGLDAVTAGNVVRLAASNVEGDTELAAYHRHLATHDWTYEYSDDHSVWQRGRQSQGELEQIQKRLDQDKVVWRQYER